MVARFRESRNDDSRGRIYRYSQKNTGGGTWYNNYTDYHSISDHVSPGDGHDLTIKHLRVSGGRVNTVLKGIPSETNLLVDNYMLGALRDPNDYVFDPLTIPGRPSDSVLAAQLLARTNPSRPVVDLPIFVYELREIPDLLRKEGGGWIKKLASLNLKYHFGIKPLVSDLLSLLSFTDEVNKREKELNALYTSGLRRKRNLWDGSVSGITARNLNSTSEFNTGTVNIQKTSSTRVWGHVEWFPDSKLGLMKGDRRALARKAVLGLTVDFSTAWNAIPWSWLIDWCSNVGDILIAHRNIVGAHHGPVRIMENIRTHGYYPKMTLEISTWKKESSPIDFRCQYKTRRTASPTLSAYLPILSARQLSILGSIGVTRRMPRSP